jgi:S-adenosylmethionine synthetase
MTSESVTVGHPDKLCDQISDSVVDAYLAAGLRTGVNAECAMASGVIFLSVRAGSEAPVDLAALARRVVAEAGYDIEDPTGGPTVMLDMSPGLELPGARAAAEARAGHMVSAFGYACGHTPEKMPYPVWAAHRLTRGLDRARGEGRVAWLSPDAQAQVAVEFRDRRPACIRAIALTFGTSERVDPETMRETLSREVIAAAIDRDGFCSAEGLRLVTVATGGLGGPDAHSGLTGRKTADDAYGSFARRSGSALSGKDPSRIDRVASYAARQAARAVLAAGLAEECEIQLSYIIGDQGPASVEVDSFGPGTRPDSDICQRLSEVIDFRVGAIAERMRLWDLPAERGGRFYRDLATYGQMGRDDLDPPWEDTEAAARLA